jgi:hypothetical protein
MQFEREFAQSLAQFTQKLSSVSVVLESNDEVIGPPRDDDITACPLLSPVLHP